MVLEGETRPCYGWHAWRGSACRGAFGEAGAAGGQLYIVGDQGAGEHQVEADQRDDVGEAALAWEGETAPCLLLPDLATVPLHIWRVALDHLLVIRRPDGDVPTLVIATTDPGRAAGWGLLVEETRQRRAEAPLAACVATWDALHASPASRPLGGGRGDQPAEGMVRRVRLRPE